MVYRKTHREKAVKKKKKSFQKGRERYIFTFITYFILNSIKYTQES